MVPCRFTIGVGSVALACLVAAGCGDGRPARVKVSGTVLVDGKPVEHGYVRVVPQGDRASTGRLGPGGKFTLGCFEKDDGCVPGTHKVVVSASQPLGTTRLKWFAPPKYAEAETSDLMVTITDPTDALTVDIKSPPGQPFVPFEVTVEPMTE